MLILFGMVSVLLGPATNHDQPLDGVYTGIALLVGALLSGGAGYIGMAIATQANSRTAEACRQSMARGLQVSFASGSVMGMGVCSLALGGLCLFYLVFTYTVGGSSTGHGTIDPTTGCVTSISTAAFSRVFNRLAGFGFGASTIGMFARVGGGVFTKAADVGSDLVGKVEQGIPEDDPRNPAVIADNVGDNGEWPSWYHFTAYAAQAYKATLIFSLTKVCTCGPITAVGDVAGMGADLFESFAGALIATATLAPRLAADHVDRTLGTTAAIMDDYNGGSARDAPRKPRGGNALVVLIRLPVT